MGIFDYIKSKFQKIEMIEIPEKMPAQSVLHLHLKDEISYLSKNYNLDHYLFVLATPNDKSSEKDKSFDFHILTGPQAGRIIRGIKPILIEGKRWSLNYGEYTAERHSKDLDDLYNGTFTYQNGKPFDEIVTHKYLVKLAEGLNDHRTLE